ncbi:bifunctional protein HldE [Synergistales bacterium]|nr:bifunctional protein HldE [Synergistales bacterium]
MKVFVFGDLFLDRYYSGEVTRVSPEAPVPVLNVTSERNVPGGAGNVAANLRSLGCEVTLCGAIGSDRFGEALTDELRKIEIDAEFLIRDDIRTIVKIRAVGNHRQIARLDFFEGQTYNEKVYYELTVKFEDLLKDCAVAVISDYNKGMCRADVCQALISLCNLKNIPLIVDPKGDDWEKYVGADWVTPNFGELQVIAGKGLGNDDESVFKYAKKISDKYNIRNVLVTRSEKGMTLYSQSQINHIPTVAKEVFDVSGAGDTVVAALAAFLANGADNLTAVKAANAAAGVVVAKEGTAAVTRAELNAALRSEYIGRVSAKIFDWDTIIETVKLWRADGKTIAVTNGCFDIFHKGHACLIQGAAKFCDKLIVAVNSDASVRRLKGCDRPINHEQDRAYVLASLECVDAVVIFSEDTPEDLLSHIRPDALVKGGDYLVEQIAGRKYAGRVELVELVDGYSTTNIIGKMKG